MTELRPDQFYLFPRFIREAKIRMNAPHLSRKVLEGFIVPPRTFMQMLYSAGRGAIGLMNIDNRAEFIDKLDKGTINEGVMSQATAGPMMMLSLFHDLQNPLFKRYRFDATEFLGGMGPALERFHSVSAELENELIHILEEAKKKDGDTKEKDENPEPDSKEESNQIHDKNLLTNDDFFKTELSDKSIAAVLKHDWMEVATKDPESFAAQLSRMVTTELFNMNQTRAKAAFLLPGGGKIAFKAGGCTVNNVALLSARAFTCVEKHIGEDIEHWGPQTEGKYEIIDNILDEEDLKKRKGGVAAQIEVLYDVTQSFVEIDSSESSSKDGEKQELDLTTVSVAVMEGWLFGGPDDELRWRLALHRPAIEFPGIQVSMTM